jgi:translation elongation factor aEF-1 beta|tara:strand:+ start:317 stop:598 length:282 start_codon:yes stop_codon:yes gene_type:complete
LSFIIVRLKILPTDAGVNSNDIVESIKNKLPDGVAIKNQNEEPIAFGLIASILDIRLEEKDGAMGALEEAIRASSIVSQVDTIAISRSSTTIK